MPYDLDDRSRASGAAGTGSGASSESHSGLTYRPLVSAEDAAACVALQGEIWGSAFDRVPGSLLRVVTHIGGLAIGAFHPSGALVGFVFSLTGLRNGQPIHWSHMLGVREDVRGIGVGRHLKEMQRAELLRRGISHVLWTFDPLQARNAHLNFNRLGVRLIDYVENMYGITASPLHHGLATDRLVVELPTSAPTRRSPPAGSNGASSAAPVMTPFPHAGDIVIAPTEIAAPTVLIEIPADLQQVMSASPGVATTWRMATRESFRTAIDRGYQVAGLRRDLTTNRAFYTLVAAPADARQGHP
jgi:predicted GNAT superfamily acetyltransferase